MLTLNHLIGFGASAHVPGTFNQIPVMTGATTGGVTASASGDDGTQLAWRSGDKSATLWASGSAGPHWLKYDFGSPVPIVAYSIQTYAPVSSPANWTFQGSDDNSAWDTLDTKSGLTWSTDEKRTYSLSAPLPKLYRYYRWNGMLAQGGGSNWIQLREVELLF